MENYCKMTDGSLRSFDYITKQKIALFENFLGSKNICTSWTQQLPCFLYSMLCKTYIYNAFHTVYLIIFFSCLHTLFDISDQTVDQTPTFSHCLSVALLRTAEVSVEIKTQDTC